MKKLFCVIGLLAIAISAQAQRAGVSKNQPKYDFQPLHFGFLIGFNQINFKAVPKLNLNGIDTLLGVHSANNYGFSLFIISDLRLGHHWNFRFEPGLSYIQRDLIYTLSSKVGETYLSEKKSVESTLVELPLLLKYSSNRVNNHRAYLLGGMKYNIDMSSQKDVEIKDLFRLKKFDYSVEFGVGWDFYFQYFKFSPQIRASYGLNDLLVRDESIYTQSIEKLNSRGIYLTLTFE